MSAPSPSAVAERPNPAPRPLSSAADWALLLLPGLIWGTSFLLTAEALEAVRPNGIAFARIAIGFATLVLVPAARRKLAPGDWPGTALLGLVWFAFPFFMFPHAQQHVSSAVTGMLNGATPLVVAVIAAILARRLPSSGVAIGLLVGLSGAALIALPTMGEGKSRAGGVLLILAAILSYGFAYNLARPLQQRSGALPVVWRALGVATLLSAPIGARDLVEARWNGGAVLCLLALGVLGTAVATVLVTIVAGRIGAARASASAFLVPVVALALGVLVRGEHVAAISVIGGAVCLAGAWWIRRASRATA